MVVFYCFLVKNATEYCVNIYTETTVYASNLVNAGLVVYARSSNFFHKLPPTLSPRELLQPAITCIGYNKPMPEVEFNLHNLQPLLIVISGPSGVGKDSVVQGMKEGGLPVHFVVTATTRPRRESEIHGKDYFFVSKEEFARMIEAQELIEYAFVYNDYKGIPKQQVRDALASGQDVVMRLDVQGAATVRRLAPEAVLIFLTTQNEEELVSRLKARKTENPDELSLRIATARQELKRVTEFDYVIVNSDGCLDNTVETVKAIITAEHQRVIPRRVSL